MAKNIHFLILFCVCSTWLTSCQLKNNQASSLETKVETPTEEEKIIAVKELLKQSVNQAIEQIAAEPDLFTSDSLLNGVFSKDILFAFDQIKKLPIGNQLIDSTLIQIGGITESSVTTIGPIMNAAIDSMTVEEVNNLLLSDSASATAYLEKIIRKPLHVACEPIILKSLDKAFIGKKTTRETWGALAGNYNKVAKSGVGKIANMNPLETVLDEFITEKILDTVFYLIAQEEMSIRKHPATRISQTMAKTFGWVGSNK